MTASTTTETLPQVFLKPRRALPFFSQHPWVFAGAIRKVEGEPPAGSEVALRSHEGEFIARGLYNPDSNIRIRLYSWDEEQHLDREFWSQRLDDALKLRRQIAVGEPRKTARRLVNSEGDALSGLTVDHYGDWLLVQLTSLALSTRQATLVELLNEKLKPQGIWLRTEKGIREAEGLVTQDGLVDGAEPPRPMFLEENGVAFGVDVTQGQKTGFFLDQRENRSAVARYVRGQRVLDMFCYTGAFGITAVKSGGAHYVVGIDASQSAVDTATANAELNGVADRMRFEKSDAFQALERLRDTGESFDTVILDPPKMARHRAGLKKALRGYFSLNQLAISVLKPGGILVSCSCSGHVDRPLFEEMLMKVSVNTNRRIQILESRGPASDHPVSVSCPESNYLKCYICRVV